MAKPFASTLSVPGFRAVRGAGFYPLRPVQGSCVYRIGWQRLPQRKMRRALQPQLLQGATIGEMGGTIGASRQYFPKGWDTAAQSFSEGMWTELEQQTGAFNEARRLALERLRDAAREAGAVAVVDLHIRRGRFGRARRAIQFSAIGTAIGSDRIAVGDGQEIPLTNLSGAEFWKLVSSGCWPLGVVGGTSVLYIVSGYRTKWARTRFAPRSRRNQEYLDYTDGLNHARRLALAHVRKEAREVGAAGILTLGLDLERHDPGLFAGERKDDLVVAVHALGTAIAPIEQGSPKETRYALDLGGR